MKFRSLIFGVDDELWKEVPFILIDAAEPVIVRNGFDAGNGQDFVAVGDRQQLHKPSTANDDQAVRACNLFPAAESALHHCQKREKEQSDGEGADGQDQANFFAKQIGEDQAAEFHAAPPASTVC